MIRSKLGLKALGLCAVVLGLMAIAAGSAQAEKGAHWNVNGKNLNEVKLTTLVQVKEIEELKDPVDPGKHLVLLTQIAKIKVKILCTGAKLEKFELLTEGSALGNIEFTGCKIFLNGSTTASVACEPHTGASKGVILTELLKGLIVLHKLASGEIDDLVLLAPDPPATQFVAIQLSEECAIGESIPVIGEFFMKDCQNLFLKEQPTHLIEEGPLTKLFVISESEEHKSVIEGSAILELEGEHKGLNWSGTPA